MALTTVNITGTFNFPDAAWSDYTRAEFHITGFDTDTEVVIPKVITSTLGTDGALDVDLWGNDDGLRGTAYRVYVVVYEGASYARELIRRDLGLIQVNGDGPFDIANMLSVPVTVPEVWYSAITEAEYDAAIAAVASSAASAAAAAISADEAAASAATIDPGNFLQVANDLSDLGDAPTALINLGVAATAAELNALDGITATVTELNYTDGVTSNIQTQLDAKAPSASPTLTTPTIQGTQTEGVYTITDGPGFAIDPTNGAIQFVTLGANRTPTQANWSNGQTVNLYISDGSARTITWSTIGVVWEGGSAPTLATAGYTAVSLEKAGGVIRGALIGEFAS